MVANRIRQRRLQIAAQDMVSAGLPWRQTAPDVFDVDEGAGVKV